MPNDAKLGLLTGLVIVIAVAVIFFRKEVAVPLRAGATAAVGAAKPTIPKPANGLQRGVRAKTTSLGDHVETDSGRVRE